MCLRGTTQKLLSDLTLGQLSDYNAVKNALSQRFQPRESEVAFRCEFRNLKRQKFETAAEYGYSLRRLAQKVYPSLRGSDIEPIIIDQYIHGLNNYELKKHVQFHHPQTINQAIAFASEYEAFVGPVDKVMKPHEQISGENTLSVQTLNCYKGETVRKSDNLTIADVSRVIDERLGKYFQRGSEAPAAKTVYNGQTQNIRRDQPRRFSNPKDIICYYCNEIGHIQTRCPHLYPKGGNKNWADQRNHDNLNE